MASIELDGVTVRRDRTEVLRGVDLRVVDGEVLALVGATGSGKTSILRAIAGLDTVVAGSVRFDGIDLTSTPPRDRDVALAFQRPALLPTRSARGNVALPLELRGATAEEIRDRVGAEARALHIEALLETHPAKLSAGQAQAVQIARSIIRQPRVLLLDEPFANIDPQWRAVLRRELHLIQRGFGVTTVIALNDPVDVMAIADRIAVVESGAIVQTGTPHEVDARPRTASAAQTTGQADLVTVDVVSDSLGAWLVADGLRVRAWQPVVTEHVGRRLQLVVRPGWWELDPAGAIEAVVDRVVVLGDRSSALAHIGDARVTIALTRRESADVAAGDRLRLRLARHRLIDPRTGIAVED